MNDLKFKGNKNLGIIFADIISTSRVVGGGRWWSEGCLVFTEYFFFCVLERITAKIASYIQVSSMQKWFLSSVFVMR